VVVTVRPEKRGERKTEQDIQDKDNRMYRIKFRFFSNFHLLTNSSHNHLPKSTRNAERHGRRPFLCALRESRNLDVPLYLCGSLRPL
jgi:hypothetical protein